MRLAVLLHYPVLGRIVFLALANGAFVAAASTAGSDAAWAPWMKGLAYVTLLGSVAGVVLMEWGSDLLVPLLRFVARPGDSVEAMWPEDADGREGPRCGTLTEVLVATVPYPENLWGLFLLHDIGAPGPTWSAKIALCGEARTLTVPLRFVRFVARGSK
jgi:hypothetical protein